MALKIRGVNLGGWLLMEGYLLGGRNIPESRFKKEFSAVHGEKELRYFEKLFRDNFIREDDFRNISAMGANTIRLPFNYRLLEPKPFSYSKVGFAYLGRALTWAAKYRLKVILDLHAAAGAQNCDWHSDCAGQAMLWQSKAYQQRTFALWERIADRFKDSPALLGYDILNEPVLGKKGSQILKQVYKQIIQRIRAVDREHEIFLEGDLWAQRVDFLRDLISEKVSISIHAYAPLNYTFNFTPFYKFPGKIEGAFWDEKRLYAHLEPYFKFARKNKTYIYMGEFGINWRGGLWGEIKYLKALLKVMRDFGFGYTYWTYKAVAGSIFPDGCYQYLPDSKYVNRQGPVFGWENYPAYWRWEKYKLANFWRTKNFTPNTKIIATLSESFRK